MQTGRPFSGDATRPMTGIKAAGFTTKSGTNAPTQFTNPLFQGMYFI